MDYDGWVAGYKVRAFDWTDGKSIYLNIARYAPGASLSQPPAQEKSFLLPKTQEEMIRTHLDSVVVDLMTPPELRQKTNPVQEPEVKEGGTQMRLGPNDPQVKEALKVLNSVCSYADFPNISGYLQNVDVHDSGSFEDLKDLAGELSQMLSTAVNLRAYMKNFPNRPGLQKLIPRSSPISQEEFHAAEEERMDNTGRVVGAYDIDLDNGEFAPLTIMAGWKVFRVDDVCTAANAAMRKKNMNWDKRFVRFLDVLEEIELKYCPATIELSGGQGLSPDDFSFMDEVIEVDGKLNFYIPTLFDTEEVFGLPSDDLHTVNVYASYDEDRHCADDSLEVLSFSDDGETVRYRYPLSEEERLLLEQKMAVYCRERYGLSLEEFAQDLKETYPTFDQTME